MKQGEGAGEVRCALAMVVMATRRGLGRGITMKAILADQGVGQRCGSMCFSANFVRS